MATTTVNATEILPGDNYFLSYDTGFRVSRIVVTGKTVKVYGDPASPVKVIKTSDTVRLHGRGLSA